MTELEAFRAEKDEFFGSHPQSPLTREQKKIFHGLNYFPENEALCLDDVEVELTIYQSEHGFFLPFVDSLAGSETYAAGRYLEPEPLPGGHFLVDFNIAYNPYCAYNEMWSCPLTPAENRLKVAVRAGEKLFHE